MKDLLRFPPIQQAWVMFYCRIMALFVLQGIVILGIYAARGFDTNPDTLPPGLRLDPMHSVIHLVTGLLGSYFAFWKPSGAFSFLRAFAVFYTGLAILGTFTRLHFGMQLEFEENSFHWTLSLIAIVIAFGFSLFPKRS